MKNINKPLVRYQDLLPIPVCNIKTAFIALDDIGISNGYWKTKQDMVNILDGKILVRKTVGSKLLKANILLQKINPTWELFITYGYRSLKIQTKLFQKTLSDIAQQIFVPNPIELYEKVHQQIAVPTVAGHPTGGAIDILILDTETNRYIDFGSEIYDYAKKTYPTFVSTISKHAKHNRQLLRSVLMNIGFAPYDGEWWHFSYGDREWAYYYKKPFALYAQLSVQQAKNLLVRRNKT